MAGLLEINELNFEAEVLKSDSKILVDFWAPWCGSCRMQFPILEELSSKISVKIVKVDADKSPNLANKYKIATMPTMILFENGIEKERFIGVQPEEVLATKLA